MDYSEVSDWGSQLRWQHWKLLTGDRSRALKGLCFSWGTRVLAPCGQAVTNGDGLCKNKQRQIRLYDKLVHPQKMSLSMVCTFFKNRIAIGTEHNKVGSLHKDHLTRRDFSNPINCNTIPFHELFSLCFCERLRYFYLQTSIFFQFLFVLFWTTRNLLKPEPIQARRYLTTEYTCKMSVTCKSCFHIETIEKNHKILVPGLLLVLERYQLQSPDNIPILPRKKYCLFPIKVPIG